MGVPIYKITATVDEITLKKLLILEKLIQLDTNATLATIFNEYFKGKDLKKNIDELWDKNLDQLKDGTNFNIEPTY